MNAVKKVGNALTVAVTAVGNAIWKFIRGFARMFVKLLKNPKGRIGLIIIGLLVLVAVGISIVDPYEELIKTDDFAQSQPPSGAHWLGTDATGKDYLFLLMHGAKVSLIIGITTAIGVTLFGATLGILAGYFGGWVDTLIMRIVDILLVIPSLPMMLLLAAMFDPYRFYHLIIIFIILGWSGTARTIRAQVLSMKESNFVKAAELAGASRAYVMFKHILPGVSHLLIMSTAMSSAGFMVAEAGLSFIGLSDPYAFSWGKLITDAQAGFLSNAWWMIIFPGLAIFIAVMGFMQLVLALEGIWNPRMGSSEKVYKLFKRLDPNYVNNVFASMEVEGEDAGNIMPPPPQKKKSKGGAKK
jgi:ABC-type dipeptide/oligopeptide/nickel transport system permease subunit